MPVFTFRARLVIKNEDTDETFSIPVRGVEIEVSSESELILEVKDLLDSLISRVKKRADFLLYEKEVSEDEEQSGPEKPETDITEFLEVDS